MKLIGGGFVINKPALCIRPKFVLKTKVLNLFLLCFNFLLENNFVPCMISISGYSCRNV